MITVRNGKRIWPVCPECGCRLSLTEWNNQYQIMHFGAGGLKDTDIRGCQCTRINEMWYAPLEKFAWLNK